MLILSIDTSCATAGVSLTQEGTVISEISINDKNTHSVKLMPAIDMLFKNAGKVVSDIDAVAVINGPGSYTGLRIGVSAAKAIAYSAEVPVIGVNTLDYLAKSVMLLGEGYICSVIDARNTHMYYGLYKSKIISGKACLERVCDYGAMPADELCELIKSKTCGRVVFCGDGVIANRDILKTSFGERYTEADSYAMLGRISAAADIASEIYEKRKADCDFSAAALDVYYLRTPRISAPKKKNDVDLH